MSVSYTHLYKDELISKEEFLSYREDYQQKETLYSKQIETLEEDVYKRQGQPLFRLEK